MWPGFLGTLTAINEDGFYIMMNTGKTKNGNVTQLNPISWVVRQAIFSFSSEDATPSNIQAFMLKYKSSGGGISDTGSNLVLVRKLKAPYSIQNPPSYVYENDKYGGVMRLPAQIDPYIDTCILATNHFKIYGVDPYNPTLNFGQPISFSSEYRYFVAANSFTSWDRTRHKLDITDFVNLEQRTASGTTEHSVIYLPDNMQFYIANTNMATALWDAPYETFTLFQFVELFEK